MDYILQNYKGNEIVLKSDNRFYAHLDKITLSSNSYEGLVKKIDSYNETTMVINSRKAFYRFRGALKRVTVLGIGGIYDTHYIIARIAFNDGGIKQTTLVPLVFLIQDCPENGEKVRICRDLLKRKKALSVKMDKIIAERNKLDKEEKKLFDAMIKVEAVRVHSTVSSRHSGAIIEPVPKVAKIKIPKE